MKKRKGRTAATIKELEKAPARFAELLARTERLAVELDRSAIEKARRDLETARAALPAKRRALATAESRVSSMPDWVAEGHATLEELVEARANCDVVAVELAQAERRIPEAEAALETAKSAVRNELDRELDEIDAATDAALAPVRDLLALARELNIEVGKLRGDRGRLGSGAITWPMSPADQVAAANAQIEFSAAVRSQALEVAAAREEARAAEHEPQRRHALSR